MRKEMNIKTVMTAVLALTMGCLASWAAPTDSLKVRTPRGWYVGAEGGLPLGYSTFSSSGYDKDRVGWSSGLFVGYRFNEMMSAELSVRYAEMTLAGQRCCVRRDYWLGNDGEWYGAPAIDKDCINYHDLKSRVKVGQYGLRFNFNVLGLFEATRNSRWAFDISPIAYAVSSKATIKTLHGNTTVMKRSARWHFGGGFNVAPSFRINNTLTVGAYSGFTFLTGQRMDGMPKHLHINNAIWDSGVRLAFNLSNGRKPQASSAEPVVPTVVVCPEEVKPVVVAPVNDADRHGVAPDTTPVVPIVVSDVKSDSVVTKTVEEAEHEFPAIYFAFNKYALRPSELPKLREILAYLKDNPDVSVVLSGWCDTRGPVYVNNRLSRQRASRVRSWLVQQGVEPERISIVGRGSDFKMKIHSRARRVVTKKK